MTIQGAYVSSAQKLYAFLYWALYQHIKKPCHVIGYSLCGLKKHRNPGSPPLLLPILPPLLLLLHPCEKVAGRPSTAQEWKAQSWRRELYKASGIQGSSRAPVFLKGIMLFPFLKMKDKLNRKARRRRQILALKRIKWRRATQHSLKKQNPGSGFRPCLQGTSDLHRNLEVSY